MIKIETMPAVSRNGIHKKAEAICGKNKWNMTSSYKKQFLDYESCLPFVLKRVVTFQYYFTFPTLLLSLSVPPSPSLPHLHTHTHTRWLSGKESACRCRRHRFNPWVRKIHGEGNDNPLQYSFLEYPMDGGAWWSGLPCPPPRDLPNPGVKPRSPILQVDSLLFEPPAMLKNTGVSSLSLLQGSSQLRNQTGVSCQAGEYFTSWATNIHCSPLEKLLHKNMLVIFYSNESSFRPSLCHIYLSNLRIQPEWIVKECLLNLSELQSAQLQSLIDHLSRSALRSLCSHYVLSNRNSPGVRVQVQFLPVRPL